MWKRCRPRILMLAICSAFPAASPAVAADAPAGAVPPQPYLSAIGRPTSLPSLRRVTVAVVEAGVDGNHPDLAGRIVGARRFSGSNPLFPASPHGTAVAGLIAAIDGNKRGIDGIAPNARLLVAGTSFDALSIAHAIRWAADRHARVINLSLAGLGPVPGYEEAVDYALARGALVVAAAGNCFDGNFTRCTPPGAEQAPAWLPHVLAVGATAADGSPSSFSIPNARWVDLAAPGEFVTTLWPTRNNPYSATPDCPFVGTTACYSTGRASNEAWGPSGTSFATAMVSAAAAILFGADPRLRPEQVASLLRETARPVADPRHQAGAGIIDIEAALERVRRGFVPKADYAEPNDGASAAARIPSTGVRATLDWHDDPVDVYRLTLRRGDTLEVHSDAPGATVSIAGHRCALSAPRRREFRYIAGRPGRYLLRLAATVGSRVGYRVTVHRIRSS
jgi:subtilisin family serine protease